MRLLFPFIAILSLHSTIFAASFPSLVVFGDSLSDMGNACPDDAKHKALFFCPFYKTGRFSDGPVWVEHLAEAFNLSLTASREGGSNYAFGGATSGWHEGEVEGVAEQIQSYLGKNKGSADGEALYVMWIGGNDIKNKLIPLDLLPNLRKNLEALIRAGARSFLVPNLPPIHQTPLARGVFAVASVLNPVLSWMFIDEEDQKISESGSFDIRTLLNSGAEWGLALYNQQLRAMLQDLQSTYGVSISHPDMFRLFRHASAHPENYSLKKASDLFLYDQFHPSKKAHKIVGDFVAWSCFGLSASQKFPNLSCTL